MLTAIMSFFSFVFSEQLIYSLIIPGLIAGIAAILASFFIPSFQYKTPIAIIGCIVVLFFVFYAGKSSNDKKWKQLVADQALVIAGLNTKSAEITTSKVVKYVEKIKTVEKIKVEFKIQYVDRYITPEIDNKFGDMPAVFGVLHNSAVRGELPNTTGNFDEKTPTASGIKLSEATKVIVDNYLICKQTELQLLSLQDWIRAQQLLYTH